MKHDMTDRAQTREVGGWVSLTLRAEMDPNLASDMHLDPDRRDHRRVVAVTTPREDVAEWTPGVPEKPVSMEVTVSSGQRFRVTVEEIL